MQMPGKRLIASAATRSSEPSVDDEIAHLRDLDPAGLRRRWQTEFGQTAPQHLTRYLLFRILAYKLQADHFGDLDADTVKTLERVGGISQKASLANELAALDRRRSTPQVGTVLVREWDRRSRHVMVTPEGFAWNGKTFESLSQVAFAITGTRWNGPRFFGLRDQPPGASPEASE
jgi:hypothetical protein